MSRRIAALALAVLLGLVAGACGNSAEPAKTNQAQARAGEGSAALQAKAALRPCPQSSGSATVPVRDLVLPCLAGGEPRVRLNHLGRPAVLNLWASWCRPCTTELPLFATVDSELGDRVLFLGVDTADSPASGLATLIDAGVHFPSVSDEKRLVQKQHGLAGLPATVFLRADGSVAHTKFGAVADADELRGLIGKYLGVTA